MKLQKKIFGILSIVAVVLLGLFIPMEVKAAQNNFNMECGNSADNIIKVMKLNQRDYRGYDKLIFNGLDMKNTDIKLVFYVEDVNCQTLNPIHSDTDSCYFLMPVIIKNDRYFDTWNMYDMSVTKVGTKTNVEIVMAATPYALENKDYDYGFLNRDLQYACKMALPGEHVMIDAGEMSSLTQGTMQAIAARRDIDVSIVCSKSKDPYVIKIPQGAKVPTDVEYAGFDGYLSGKFKRQKLTMEVLEGKNQYVDISDIESYEDANKKLYNALLFAPKDTTIVVVATNIDSFTPLVMETISKRDDLKLRVYYQIKGVEYYSQIATGSQLWKDGGEKAIYMGFAGFVAGRYGATQVTEEAK